jgi:hypothetical protein
LTQAINSMYFWYQQAGVCYAYLDDVSTPNGLTGLAEIPKSLPNSQWFTRGWTLQELIAPKVVWFFSESWTEIGRKDNLVQELSRITGIHADALQPAAKMKQFSVAERMSWASNRVTTRTEDKAYCLMGIFDVNMPPLYGEREKAFIRLQEEIMKSSDDQSIFAWTDMSWKDMSATPDTYSGLLASSPKHFSDSRITSLGVWARTEPYSITNKGLKVQLYLEPTGQPGVYIASLDCSKSDQQGAAIRIYLKRVSGLDTEWSQSYTAQFARIQCADPRWKLPDMSQRKGKYRTIYVRQDQDLEFHKPKTAFESVRLIINGAQPPAYRVYPSSQWNPQTGMFQLQRENLTELCKFSKEGAASFNQSGVDYLVIFGLTKLGDDWSVWTVVSGMGSRQDNCLQSTFEAYKCTEKEKDKWDFEEGRYVPSGSTTKLEFSVVARSGEHFKTPIWTVEVTWAEVPRYTPRELEERQHQIELIERFKKAQGRARG